MKVQAMALKSIEQDRAWPVVLCFFALLLATGCQSATSSSDEQTEEHHERGGADRLDLSRQALETIGLKTGKVRWATYVDTIVVPGSVVEIPGQTIQQVPAPVDGIVKRVLCAEGELVQPGVPLFELHLMLEEFEGDQAKLLELAAAHRLIEDEIDRIIGPTKEGVLPGKGLINKTNELMRIQSQISAIQQQLKLRGLTDKQIKQIEGTSEKLGTLVHSIVVKAPAELPKEMGKFHIDKLNVNVGDHLEHGASLCSMANLSVLDIKGQAFGADMPYLEKIITTDRPVKVVLGSDLSRLQTVAGLKVERLESKVDTNTRLHSFFVRLPNQLLNESSQSKFAQWTYSPGERVKIHLPITVLKKRVVLPMAAVAQDGLESYVFRQNGDL
ncbi:MAG: efflux RND transporter periplasmic adaptor subunit, partial [Planctomycetales bacterium]